MKLFNIFKHIITILFVLLLIGCEELPVTDSIFETDQAEWDPQIISLEVNMWDWNDMINSGTINWVGNEFALEFSWMLESHSYSDQLIHSNTPTNVWSDWKLNSSNITIHSLDDGQYTFHVKSRIELVEQEEASTVDFEIDAISEPALRIYPFKQVVNTDDEIDVHLYFEEVPEDSAVTGLDLSIWVEPGLEFITDSFDYGELITNFPGTTIFPDPSYGEDGRTVSIVGVADSSGTGIYGTGSIATFRLRVTGFWNAGNSYKIDVWMNELKDINGDNLAFGIFDGSVNVRQ